MGKTLGEERLAKISDQTVDGLVETLAHHRLGDVVRRADGVYKAIALPASDETAAMHLVSRMYTDAIFDQDIRAIQLIINRIDGGLPKDIDVDSVQTQFGDCLNEVMNYTSEQMLKLMPNDSVMLALCKSLYVLATQNIYWNYDKGCPCKPTAERKTERDTAMRMILERVGGRKTITSKASEKVSIETADWIKELPQ